MLNQEIRNKIQLLWDRLWAGGLSNPITAIENISYLLFMKRLEKFHPEVMNEYKWSNYHTLKGDELKKRVGNAFTYIQKDLAKKDEPFAQAMINARFDITTASLLEESIEIIDEIYKEIEKEEAKNQHFQDLQGDIYEYLLNATSQAGKNGQFRTPRHIIQMMAELVQPDIKDSNTQICDVTSGSSGFLVGAYQYILKENTTPKKRETDEDNHLEKGLVGDLLKEKQYKQLKEKTFIGFDIDPTMVRIGMMNMMMHGIDKPNIFHINTLAPQYENQYIDSNLLTPNEDKNQEKKRVEEYNKLFPNLGKEQFSYILANPPFAAKVNSKEISSNLNRVYDSKKSQSLQTELLFLERIIYMLKNEGKCAVIVPEGVLFNSGKAYKTIREILLKDCDLNAVISLPSGVFNPYTAVKTSILLFTKKEFNSSQFNTQKVWFYELESDGYTLDTNRKKILDDYPLPEMISSYKAQKLHPQDDRKNKYFYVDIEEIKKNGYALNLNLYKEFVFEEQNYEPPQELFKQLLKLEEEINKAFQHLGNIINEN